MGRMSAQDKELVKRMTFLRRLLKEFKAQLHGYDPGVSFLVKNGKRWLPSTTPFKAPKEIDHWKVFHTDGADWKWLEPLLIELRTFRRKAKMGSGKRSGRG